MYTDEPFKFPELVDAVQEVRRKCMQKRLKYTKRNGEVVILRDVFEKVMKWVIKFREAGDMAAQYDPAHAALPWAGVRLLLQVAINDAESFGAMAEGVEFVSKSITRYELIERLYLEKDSMAKVDLRRAVIAQHAAILQYLSKAVRFYSRKTTGEL
jgi:N-terminal domain of NWD NACHT-NTPase